MNPNLHPDQFYNLTDDGVTKLDASGNLLATMRARPLHGVVTDSEGKMRGPAGRASLSYAPTADDFKDMGKAPYDVVWKGRM